MGMLVSCLSGGVCCSCKFSFDLIANTVLNISKRLQDGDGVSPFPILDVSSTCNRFEDTLRLFIHVMVF